jgi:molecular chaperone GrpE
MSDENVKKWEKIAEESFSEELSEKEEGGSAPSELSEGQVQNPEIEKLQKNVADLTYELDNAQQKILRVMAEADNTKRRATRDVENAHKYALEKFSQELLPVIDSLDRALSIEAGEAADVKAIQEGLTLTMQMFEKVWSKFGIKQLNPIGEAFDPTYHEAVTAQPSPGSAPNTVLAVIQKGYLLNDRLVRAAMVVVSA